MVWADFHPIALATPLILAAFYYLRNDRYGWFFFFAVLTGMTKETAPIAVGLLGAWCGFAKRRWLMGAGIILVSFFWFYVGLNVIVPAFHPENRYIHTMRYHYLGSGIGEMLKTLVTRPLWVISFNLSPLELKYPFRLFGPVAFLSFLTPAGLLAIPYFLMNWLEAGNLQVRFNLHYQAELTAFLFIATVYGVKRALWWRSDSSSLRTTPNLNRVKAIGGILMASSFLFFNRSAMFGLRAHWPGEERRTAQKALALLPPGASVSADDQIAPHLGDRRRLYFFPKTDSVEFVVLIGRLPRKHREEEMRLEQKGFRLIFSENSVRVYRRPDPAPGQPKS